MNDYNEMSDFEINRLVAIKSGHKSYHEDGSYTNDGRNVTVKGNGIIGWFNPCNNPSDMWPLIVGNGICLTSPIKPRDKWVASWFIEGGNWSINDATFSDKKPLRAAAIVYLMLNGEK